MDIMTTQNEAGMKKRKRSVGFTHMVKETMGCGCTVLASVFAVACQTLDYRYQWPVLEVDRLRSVKNFLDCPSETFFKMS